MAQLNSNKFVKAYWEELSNKPEFKEFVETQFQQAIADASTNQKALFGFGSRQDALRAFIEQHGYKTT